MDNWDATISPPELKPEDIFKPHEMARIDSTRTWVDPAGYRLDDRLWRSRAKDRAQIDDVLREGLAKGASPLQTAKALEGMLNPYYQPRRDPKTFRVLPKALQPKGVATTTPRQGPGKGPMRPRNSGTGSYAARRLARTETTRAFGDATIQAAKANPVLERLRWRRSAHHHDSDQCDLNAERSSRDQPPGVYWVDELPQYPDHPHEMCTLNPYVTNQDLDSAVQRLRHYVNTGVMPDRNFVPPPGGVVLRPPAPKAPAKARKARGPQTDPAKMTKAQFAAEMEQLRTDWYYAKTPEERERLTMRAGAMVQPRMMKNLGAKNAAIWERHMALEADLKAARASDDFWRREAGQRMLTHDERRSMFDASRARSNLEHQQRMNLADMEHTEKGNPFYRAIKKTVTESGREMHTGKAAPGNFALNSTRPAMSQIQKSAEAIPVEWWRQSNAYGPIASQQIDRGYYAHTTMYDQSRGQYYPAELMLSGTSPEANIKTGVHELGHRMESLRPKIVEAERVFYNRRTQGESLQTIYPGRPDLENEVGRPDKFGSLYMGKDYSANKNGSLGFDPGAYEVLTMGMEDVMRQDGALPSYLKPGQDDDYLQFILGILAVG